MSIFEEWGKKIGDVAEAASGKAKEVASTAADKTKDVVELARLSADVSSEERLINKVYTELGIIVFDQEKDSEDSIYKDKLDKIKLHLKNIDEYNKRIRDIKGDNEQEVKTQEEPPDKSKEYVDITPAGDSKDDA